ncbi:MAG: M42 family metallopeptidase [Chloroflexi bacterium]|nr:M42 family metallopeptidase [Chloroflexota bacterium]
MKDLIKLFVETYGPSGNEDRIRQTIRQQVKDHADEVRVDAMGNLIVRRAGKSDGLKVMLAAHMDEIGIIVTHVDEKGFLRFAPVGGVWSLGLLGRRVQFADGTVGIFGLEKWTEREKVPPMDKMFLDVGAASKDEVKVRVGDVACFLEPLTVAGDRLIAKAFDDRIGCAVIAQTLMSLESSPHDLYFVFTVQEEVGLRGATTSAFGVAPDMGIAVDVTLTGDTPEAHPMAVSLGKGPAIKVADRSMLAHPGVKRVLAEAAERAGVPYQYEVLEFGGTDAAAIQLSRQGVPTGCLSIPSRYVHSPSEMVDYNDVQNAVKLLVSLLSAPIDLG